MSVYSSVEQGLISEGNNIRLKTILSDNRGRFHRAKNLSLMCGFKSGNTDVSVRKAISELIEDGCPIIATSRGFKWATSEQELNDYIYSLECRLAGIYRRVEAIRRVKDGFR